MKILGFAISFTFYLTVLASSSQECTESLQSCVRVYMDSVFQHAQQENIDLICQDLRVFTKCVFDQKCDIPESHRKTFIDNVQKEMKNQDIDCDMDADSNKGAKAERNSNGENINKAPLFVLFITAMIVFLILKLN